MVSTVFIILASFCIAAVLSLPLESTVESRAAMQQTITDADDTSSNSRSTRQTGDDNHGFPVDLELQPDLPTDGCFVLVNNTYPSAGSHDGTATFISRTCCEGYTGKDCNVLIDPFSASDPCNGKVCPNDPEAQCAVIIQCGVEVAIFLNELGQIIDNCEVDDNTIRPTETTLTDDESDNDNNSTNSSSLADTDISTLACHGYCDFDPCEGQVCAPFPDAFCFQSGCDCKPTWFLDTGVQVNCTSGLEVEPSIATRTRRQATIIGSSCK